MAKSIFFVDRRVTDYVNLLSGLPEDTEIFLLDLDRDGITQMVDFLAGRAGFDSIQIISHGSAGALYLGSTTLTNDNLLTYQEPLSRIGQTLNDTGDILLYGCNVAQGNTGQDFITQLADLTGAEVAASMNLTGAAQLGGDWNLEASTGPIETASMKTADYNELLGVLVNESFNDGVLNTGAWSYFGYTVSEHNGYLDIQTTETDRGGYAVYTFDENVVDINLTMRSFHHTEELSGTYYYGDTYFSFISATGDTIEFDLQMQHSDYAPNYENNPINHDHPKIAISSSSGVGIY